MLMIALAVSKLATVGCPALSVAATDAAKRKLLSRMFEQALRLLRVAAFVVVATPAACWPAWSQQPLAMETTLVAEVRVEPAEQDNRGPHFIPARVLKEGQELFYTLRIRNPSTEFARAVVVVQEIPKNTTYVPQSAAGPGVLITFSADGGQSYAQEGQLRVTDTAGVSRTAQPQDYTNIRWQLRNPLAPGAIALARFRAIFR